jgi:hypothetical protein
VLGANEKVSSCACVCVCGVYAVGVRVLCVDVWVRECVPHVLPSVRCNCH